MSFFSFIKKGLVSVRDTTIYGRNQVSVFIRRLVSDQHQLTSTTSLDRYPELFNEVQFKVSDTDPLSILSFGCSTGEECFTMKTYFPNATITGVDINKRNLKKAIAKNTYNDVKFLYSTPEIIAANGKYDLIFALSVLCRWEDTKDVEYCGDIYPFEKFSETVNMLASQLLDDGLLVIYNSNFRFEDTAIASQFSVVETPSIEHSGFVHKFDSTNRKLRENHRACVYRKKKR